jgi:aerobic-type carbon monoxide dehydrogenase small subunit (CoxS/CutS family)
MSETVTIYVNGAPLVVQAGRSIGAALLATCGPALRVTGRQGAPRGMYCGMGICFDCLITIDGRPGQRACMVPVRAGQRIELP